MTVHVGVGEARTKLSALLRQAESGDDVIVTRNGRAIAKITALRQRQPGFMRGQIVVHDDDWWIADGSGPFETTPSH